MKALATLSALAVLVLLLLGPRDALTQNTTRLSMAAVMTPQELQETGVALLTATQRAALDRWLNRYTEVVLTVGGSSAREGASIPRRGSPFLGRVYAGIGGGHWINDNSSSGSIIALEDGSLWEINSLDRIDTALWLPITNITVLNADAPVGDYRYLLINTEDGEKALAKYLGSK